MIVFAPKPIPCHTDAGEGYILYVNDNGIYENDEVCVVLLDGGKPLFCDITTVRVWHNETYGIKKKVVNLKQKGALRK